MAAIAATMSTRSNKMLPQRRRQWCCFNADFLREQYQACQIKPTTLFNRNYRCSLRLSFTLRAVYQKKNSICFYKSFDGMRMYQHTSSLQIFLSFAVPRNLFVLFCFVLCEIFFYLPYLLTAKFSNGTCCLLQLCIEPCFPLITNLNIIVNFQT